MIIGNSERFKYQFLYIFERLKKRNKNVIPSKKTRCIFSVFSIGR